MNKFRNSIALGNFDLSDEQNRQLAMSTTLKCAGLNFKIIYLYLRK